MTADELEALIAKATPGDLTTAERHTEHEYVECPMCSGQGEVAAADYCNFDGVAVGVQFYGIGKEFGAHETLWTALVNDAAQIAADKRRIVALTRVLERIVSKDPKWQGDERLARSMAGIARQALETPDAN